MKKIVALLAFMMLCTPLMAQRKSEQLPDMLLSPTKSFAQSLADSYQAFYSSGGVFEKLYLMTDKPYYSAGETLFFSGYLVHATLLTRNSNSMFVYAELISPEGQLVERIKVAASQKQFIGTFMLNARLTSGRYTLRAYTRWMTNFDMGYFYTREIYIGNYIDDAVQTAVDYTIDEKGMVTASVRIFDQYSMPIVSTPVKYRLVIDDKSRSGTIRSDKDGKVAIRFRPSESVNDCLELRIRANSRDLQRYIQLPSFSSDYDVQFCPEGGNLIAGTVQIVAFRAQGANGRSTEVEGVVYNSAGEKIADIATVHNGMGRFVMRAEHGQSYYADFSSKQGLVRRFNLPTVEPQGVALRVMRQRDGYTIIAQPSAGVNIADYAAVIHSRGAVMSVVENLSRPIRVMNSDMFDGIAQVSIVERTSGTVVAERLFYVRDNRYAQAQIITSKPKYERRDRVGVDIRITDSDGKPVTGNFSMTVTDATVVEHTAGEQNILSYMLLSSDLKGEVENAGEYFVDSEPKTLDNLDLVMMTGGWRRYSLSAVIAGEHPRILYPMEDSERIRGSVFGLIGRAKKPSVVLMNPKTKYVEQFELNEYNNFIIAGLEAKEDTQYIVQALNKKGRDKTVRIEIETENFPVTTSSHIREFYLSPAMPIPSIFLTRAKERYFYEGGERVIDIEEIVVMGRRTSSFFATSTAGSMLHGDLSRFATVYDALATFKELDVLGTSVTTKNHYAARDVRVSFYEENNDTEEGEGDSQFIQTVPAIERDVNVPDVYINGNLADIEELGNYDTKYIERLSFADGRAATMLGLAAQQGAILMEVSREGMVSTIDTDAMARVLIRGSHKPVEFYKPKYPTPDSRLTSVQDLRSTIAWEPLIRPTETGTTSLYFYTADRPATYHLTLEGITDNGELLHKVIEIPVGE
ncbi:MAG: hypothetical protein IJX65_03845 [Alistipes sp.]|nr:hypothetical protein [Alistipes sp.]